MNFYNFDLVSPLSYHLAGKFKAPSPSWKHLDFPLEDYELIVVTEGTLNISDNHGTYRVQTGEHLLLPPTKLNRRYAKLPSYCSFYWLHFSYNESNSSIPHNISQDSLHRLATQSTESSILTIPKQGKLESLEKIIILMKQLQDSIRSHYDKIFLDYTTSIILSELHHQYHPKIWDSSPLKVQLYNDIVDYIHLTLHSNLRVSQIALQFGYNEKYLSHLFQSIQGLTLKQYIINEKMELAKYILMDTNDTIKEIASCLSYEDSHNFMKAFKKIVGLTPTQYRNAYSKRLLYDK